MSNNNHYLLNIGYHYPINNNHHYFLHTKTDTQILYYGIHRLIATSIMVKKI